MSKSTEEEEVTLSSISTPREFSLTVRPDGRNTFTYTYGYWTAILWEDKVL